MKSEKKRKVWMLKLLLSQPGYAYFTFFILVGLYIFYQMPKTSWNLLNFFILSPTSWTLQEYLAHRFLMHGFVQSISHAHGLHHKLPNAKEKIFIPMLLTLLFAIGNALPIYFVCGYWSSVINLASSVMCYCSFEYSHWICHCSDKSLMIYKGIRRFHLLHHAYQFESVKQQNYGFTSATWDIIFGTCEPMLQKARGSEVLLIPLPVLPLMLHTLISENFYNND